MPFANLPVVSFTLTLGLLVGFQQSADTALADEDWPPSRVSAGGLVPGPGAEAVGVVRIDEVAMNDLIARYGASLPDEYHPPLPAAAPGSMQPDAQALIAAQMVYADALDAYGFSAKAERVLALAEASMEARTGPTGPPVAVELVHGGSQSGYSDSLLSDDCEDESYFCNYSDTWLKIKGDYYVWSQVSCSTNQVGWVGPDQCVGYGWGGWFDIDNIWNCSGDLRVGSTTVGPGEDSWHPRNGSTTTAYDDPSSPDVYLDTCTIGCYWDGCTNCC
jgi:hypothetical protein